VKLPARVSSWKIVLGDGNTREGTGTPPHFAGHTYVHAGTFRVLLLVDAPAGTRYAATAEIVAAGPGGGGGTTPTTTTTTTTTTPAPPATGTVTGTVLVNGRPFTGGTIPYGSRHDEARLIIRVREHIAVRIQPAQLFDLGAEEQCAGLAFGRIAERPGCLAVRRRDRHLNWPRDAEPRTD
jgi:hypothetical protein